MIGIDGPYISASKTPTENPILAKETAKLAVVVDFPTPPFPDATAIIFLIPGIALPLISGLSATSTLVFTFTLASGETNS